MIRLRQIALAARDLEPVVEDLRAVLGLQVAHRDPAVAVFGLHNAVLPAGHQFLEVVAPTRDGTAAGRFIERRGGDGGYMVILQCDDHGPVKARVDALGVRKVVEQDTDGYQLMQLHPRDTGGSLLEIDVQVGGDALDGPWEPAGPDWQLACSETVAGITAAEIRAEDPAAVAARWAAVLGLPVGGTDDDGPVIHLDNAVLRFVPAVEGRGEGLVGIDLGVTAPADVMSIAERRRLPVRDGAVTIGGLRVRLDAAVGRRVPGGGL